MVVPRKIKKKKGFRPPQKLSTANSSLVRDGRDLEIICLLGTVSEELEEKNVEGRSNHIYCMHP